MSEPVYDEDLVNLGYLKRKISETEDNINGEYSNVSRHYGSQPVPPYYKGDTWVDGNIVYTCINTRLVGLYTASDWTTESGAMQKAESKNKIYLSQPSNYSVGDMWILQSDNDHKAGKKGDILITTVGRQTYNEDDWISMLGYGSIASINEILGNINEAVDTLELTKESGILTIAYTDSVPVLNENDLWYVINDTENYLKGELYKYSNGTLIKITDENIVNAFAEASQSNITVDGKIQIFYEDREDITTMTLGDICNENGILYRYNGTKWVEVYDTKLQETIKNLNTITQRLVNITTDLGTINQTVSETITTMDELTGDIVSINEEISNIKQTQESWTAEFKHTGGNNLFYYDLALWQAYSGVEEYSDTEFKNNTVSGRGYLIGSGSSKQSIEVPNGMYTISFKYKKIGSELTNASVKINGTEYSLTETSWTDFVKTIEITTNHIEVEFTADTNDTLYIADLMGNAGTEANIWTQNPNETRTDTVKIGKGIQVDSSETNTYTRIDADGNRTYNKTTGERVAEMTDKGVYAKEIECVGQAQIAGVLIQQIGDQTWFSSLL